MRKVCLMTTISISLSFKLTNKNINNKPDVMSNIHPQLLTRPQPRMTLISNKIVYDIPEEESEWDDLNEVD